MSNINYLKVIKVCMTSGDVKNLSDAIKIANSYAKSLFLTYKNRILIEIAEGNYSDINTSLKELEPAEYIDLIGAGDKSKTIITIRPNAQQLQSDKFDGRRFEGLFLHNTCKVSNLTIILRDGRYPIHIEPITPKHTFHIELNNVHLIHKGNDYALSCNPKFFSSPSALGVGLGNGCELSLINCTFESFAGQAVGIHNNIDFFKPAKVLIDQCKFITLKAKNNCDLTLKSLNPNTHDLVSILNTCFSSGIKIVSYTGCKHFLCNISGEQPKFKSSKILDEAQ